MPASIDKLIECTVATQNLAAYPGGKAVPEPRTRPRTACPIPTRTRSTATRRWSSACDTIASLGANGDNKADVLKALFAIKDTESVLGTFGFNKDGDTTLKSYGALQGRHQRRRRSSSRR